MPRFQKYHWLMGSILLWVISLGLHGLVMLIPIPEAEDIVKEPKIEQPESIRVSELPKKLPKESVPEPIIPEPVFPPPEPVLPAPVSAPAVEPSPLPAPAVILPSEVASLPPEPLLNQSLEPSAPDTPPPQALPVETLPQENLPLEEESSIRQPDTRQTYDDTLVSTPRVGAGSPLDELITSHQLDEEAGIPMKVIRAALALNFPDADICFENLDISQPIRISSGIVLALTTDSHGQSFIEAIDGRLLQLTGYTTLNRWAEQSILPSIDVEPNAGSEATEIPELAPVDIVSWIRDNTRGDIFKPNEEMKLFTFPVDVTVMNNLCE